jgi:hypothetical protein
VEYFDADIVGTFLKTEKAGTWCVKIVLNPYVKMLGLLNQNDPSKLRSYLS